MRYHRLMLDYDGLSYDVVLEDCKKLSEKYKLGKFVIEPSETPGCWWVRFPESRLTFEEALTIAKDSLCDKRWLKFCERYKCFALRSKVTLKFRKCEECGTVKNRPREIKSPVRLIVIPETELDYKRICRLCESINDEEWEWNVSLPVHLAYEEGFKGQIEIGCRDVHQAFRRIKFISDTGVKCKFVVKEGENGSKGKQ